MSTILVVKNDCFGFKMSRQELFLPTSVGTSRVNLKKGDIVLVLSEEYGEFYILHHIHDLIYATTCDFVNAE